LFLIEKVELLVRHRNGELDGLLRTLKIFRVSGAACRLPFVMVFSCQRDLAQLGLAEPIGMALIRAFPEWLCLFVFLRRRLQRSSSAPSSSCAGLRPRPTPSAARRWRAPSSAPWRRAPSALGAAW